VKKNISYIPMDSNLEIWLLEKLIKEPPKSDCVEDFLSGIRDMISGEVSSLILGASEETELSASALSDGIIIGELEIHPKSRKVLQKGSEISLTPKEFDIFCIFFPRIGARSLLKSRFIVQSGKMIICWMTATSWHLSENCARRLSLTQMLRSTF